MKLRLLPISSAILCSLLASTAFCFSHSSLKSESHSVAVTVYHTGARYPFDIKLTDAYNHTATKHINSNDGTYTFSPEDLAALSGNAVTLSANITKSLAINLDKNIAVTCYTDNGCMLANK